MKTSRRAKLFFVFAITIVSIMLLVLFSDHNTLVSHGLYQENQNAFYKVIRSGDDTPGGFSLTAGLQTDDNGYIVGGKMGDSGTLMKLDSSGNIIWRKTFDVFSSVNNIQQTNDGNYIVVFSGIIALLDSFGNLEWQKNHECSASIVNPTGDNGFIAVADGGRTGICKLDSSGNLQWSIDFPNSFPTEEFLVFDVEQTNDEGFIVAGEESRNGVRFGVLVRLKNNGTLLWKKTYRIGSFGFSSVHETKEGNLVVTGATYSFELWVIKTDQNGELIWSKNYSSTSLDNSPNILDWGDFIIQNQNGNYVVAGTTQGFGNGADDIWIMELNKDDGTPLWQRTFGDVGSERVEFFQQTLDGGYFFGGYTDAPDNAGIIIKTDPAGNISDCSFVGLSDANFYDTSFPINDPSIEIQPITRTLREQQVEVVENAQIREEYKCFSGERTYIISGRVEDESGFPLARVTIDYGIGNTVTDPNGNYVIADLLEGTYTLTPSLEPYRFDPATITVGPNGIIDFMAKGLDLSIVSIEPVQSVELNQLHNPLLVRDKLTGIKVVLGKSGNMVEHVDVRLQLNGKNYSEFYVMESENQDERTYRLLNDNSTYPLSFDEGDSTKTIYFFSEDFRPISNSFEVHLTLDPNDLIAESNELNNTDSAEFDVVETSWGQEPNLYIHYFLLDWENIDHDEINPFYIDSSNYLRDVFPVSESNFSPDITNTSSLQSKEICDIPRFDGRFNRLELFICMAQLLHSVAKAAPEADRYVLILPNGWFENNTTCPTCGKGGLTHPYLPLLALVELLPEKIKPNGSRVQVIAHELGHTYELPSGLPEDCKEEYYVCSGLDAEDFGFPSAPGLWVSMNIPIQHEGRFIFSIMALGAIEGEDVDELEYWIKADDFSFLLENHLANRPLSSNTNKISSTSTRSQSSIFISGIILESGELSTFESYVLPHSEIDTENDGPYSILLLNKNGREVFEFGFETLEIAENNQPAFEIFAVRIPYIEEASKVLITRGTDIIGEKLISPNSPVIKIVTPNGGEISSQSTKIEWSGFDEDGDILSYSVLYSSDNGESWIPITRISQETSYQWDTSNLPPGSSYLVKVFADDGFNTTESISASTFTITSSSLLSKDEEPTLAFRNATLIFLSLFILAAAYIVIRKYRDSLR